MDEVLGGLDAAMLVVGIEKWPAERRRDVWPRVTDGDITEFIKRVQDLDFLKFKRNLAI